MSFNLRSLFSGLDEPFPTADGQFKPYINFDNAASTPPFQAVAGIVQAYLPWYSSVHRGTGLKSQVSTELYDYIHREVLSFVGGDPGPEVAVFGKNATEAINIAACRFNLKKDDIVLVTLLEHHSNLLPWRARARVKTIRVTPKGGVDLNHMEDLLRRYRGGIKLAAVTGASNVTGIMPEIHEAARLAHRYGAKILVDAAQLIPHRKIDVRPFDDPGHLDFLVFSAHKMYAPFGTGVLVAPRDFLESRPPEYVGGGTVRYVLGKEIVFSKSPEKDEAGSPNVLGALALWQAMRIYQKTGYPAVEAHEKKLLRYALDKLSRLSFIKIYGDLNPFSRLGVISFNMDDAPHGLVASVLGGEAGIGVRNGCFCAQPYVAKLLGLTSRDLKKMEEEIYAGGRDLPGMIRISFGMYNTLEEIDCFLEWLMEIRNRISRGLYRGKYVLNRETGLYYIPERRLKPEAFFPAT
ncbi:MAG: aminotransferase class V-fold PLP-dependent enzyme [Bacillota bacterium]